MKLLTLLPRLERLAIYGYGQEGQSLQRWLQQQYPHLQIDILNDSALSLPDVCVYTGAAVAARLLDYALVFKSPGISPYQASIQNALAHGVQFSSATALWFATHPAAKSVVISGSKGKSTTSSLVAHILKAQGHEVVLAGNIGHPLLDQCAGDRAIWVLELSSYQLWDFNAAPAIVALLNLFPEHLDWHGSVERYYHDKLHLLTRPPTSTLRISNAEDSCIAEFYQGKVDRYFNHPEGFHVRDGRLYQAEQALSCEGFALRGVHNLKNLAAALTIVAQLGVEPASACACLHHFEALPHRLMYLGERAGLHYVDDSISTTPQSALAAVSSFTDQQLTLILGGYDRGLDWQILAQALPESSVVCVITLPDNAVKIQKAITTVPNSPPCYTALDMSMAINLAQQHSVKGGMVLLSPGSPSYGHYRDFKQRGQSFARLAGF